MTDDSIETWISSPLSLEGVGVVSGVGIGYAFLHDDKELSFVFDKPVIKKDEIVRLNQAFLMLNQEIEYLLNFDFINIVRESKEVLETFKMLSIDQGWKNHLIVEIEKGACAEEAIQIVLKTTKEKFNANGTLRVCSSDLEDISIRLLKHLCSDEKLESYKTLINNQPIVVFAKNLGVADLLEYHNKNLKGVVLSDSAHASHMVILARSLGIPVVVGVNSTLKTVDNTSSVLVNGGTGHVYIRPVTSLLQQFGKKITHEIEPLFRFSVDKESITTLDGITIDLFVNANLQEDLEVLKHDIIKGIGLYRTEIPFMMKDKLPSVDTQIEFYKNVLNNAQNKPVLFRTLDIGGDKIVSGFQTHNSDLNQKKIPQLRAIRLTLDRPMIMRQQIRALFRARCQSQYPDLPLYLMIPMLAEPKEFVATLQLIDLELEREKNRGNPIPKEIRAGAMIEVPALVHQLSDLVPLVDFLTIGSNDLFQYFYAIDRDNLQVFQRYDVLSPAFLTFLKSIYNQIQPYDIPLSLCGEMASFPLEAMALLGLGLRKLSVSPNAIEPIYKMVSSLNLEKFTPYLASICQQMSSPITLGEMRFGTSMSLRQKLKDFAKDHGVVI